MKIWDIVSKAGKVALSSLIPGGGLIVDVINEFMPEDKKLPKDATGEQARTAIESLPPEQAAQIFSKELDVEIAEIQEFTKVMTVLADADKTGASTRPEIALMMAKTTCFAVITSVSIWAYSVIMNQISMMGFLKDSWPLLLSILGVPAALLRAYFGMRSKEKKARYDMAAHVEPQGNALSQIIRMFKK